MTPSRPAADPRRGAPLALRAAGAAILAVTLLTAPESARADDLDAALDCSEMVCVGIIGAPERHAVGEVLSVSVAYRVQAGEYPDGLEIVIDPPDHFMATHVAVAEPHFTYLDGHGTGAYKDSSPCAIETHDPWNVRCGVRRAPFTVSNNADVVTFDVQLRPQLWATPAGYTAELRATISGRHRATPGGEALEVSHSATEDVAMVVEANPMVNSGNITRHFAGTGDAGVGYRQGLPSVTALNGTNVTRVPNPNAHEPGEPSFLEGVAFRLNVSIQNAIPARSEYNADGALYAPSLAEPAAFDQTIPRPTPPMHGSAALHDFELRYRLPPWVRFLGTSGGFDADNFTAWSAPSVGALGDPATPVGGVLDTPLGVSNPLSVPIGPSHTSTNTYRFPVAGHINLAIDFMVPCDQLAALDADPDTSGVRWAPDLPLFGVDASATSFVDDGAGGVAPRAHTIAFADYNPFYHAGPNSLPQSCPGPGLGPANTKGRQAHHPGLVQTGTQMLWGIAFYPLANHFDGYGDAAVLDFVPPFTELRIAGSNATPSDSFGPAWFCVLPRPQLIEDGAPDRFVYDPYDTQAWFDPLDHDPELPYDGLAPGSGLRWNPALEAGCLRASEVCDHAPARRDYGSCVVGQDGKLALAHEITAVLWRTDDDATSDIDGWSWPPDDSRFGAVIPYRFGSNISTWVGPLDPPADAVDPPVVHTRNYARFSGGAFRVGGGPVQVLGGEGLDLSGDGLTDTTWNPLVTAFYIIDNRVKLDTWLFTHTGSTANRGEILRAFPRFLVGPTALGSLRFVFTFPEGFDPALEAQDVGPIPDGEDDPTTPFAIAAPLYGLPVAVDPANPFGLTGPRERLLVASSVANGWDAAGPLTEDDLDEATLSWVDGRWQLAAALSEDYVTQSLGAQHPNWRTLAIHMRPRPDYPFVSGRNYPAVLRASVPGYQGDGVSNVVTFPGDDDAWRQTQANYQVLMTAAMQAVAAPTCVPGSTAPAFDLHYRNTSGVDIFGARAMLAIPADSPDHPPVRFAGAAIAPDGYPAGTSPVIEVSRVSNDGFAAQAWEPYWAAADPGVAFDPALYHEVRLVRVRFGSTAAPENLLPAWYGDGLVRVALAHPDATPGDIGAPISTVGYIGASPTEGGPLVPVGASEPSDPFLVGQCPATLQVTKFYDADGDGGQGLDEPTIEGWPITLDPAPGQSVAAAGVVDNSTRVVATDASGVATFDVWPGQVPTISEALPAPAAVPVPDASGTAATLSWAVTTPVGAPSTSQTLAAVGFGATIFAQFGNVCACDTSANLCVTAACVPPATPGADATCSFSHVGPTACDDAEDVCLLDSGSCDPATGQCAYPAAPCAPDVPTRVYIPIEAPGDVLLGSAVCDLTHATDGAVVAVTCLTRDEGGTEVLDIQDVQVCGP